VDDMGYGDLAAHGNQVIKTPHMDQIYNESVRFTNFCVSPTCSPTRAALMTGKHEFKVDVTHTTANRNNLALDERTVADVLKSSGYKTGIFGKWHLGDSGKYRPENRGFDVSLTSINDTQGDHFDPVLLRNGQKENFKGYRTDILFDEAMKFIEENRDSSFFCYIPTYSPHSPLVVPSHYSAMYRGRSDNEKNFLGMVSCVDHNIGLLREKINELGLNDETIIILMNDNGGTFGVDIWNAGMRGRKAATLYGGIRALSFWCWPKHWNPGEREQMTGHVDVLPTIAEIVKVKLGKSFEKDLDGESLLPLIQNADVSKRSFNEERMLVYHRGRWDVSPEMTKQENIEDHKYSYCSVRYNHYILVRAQPCSNPDCQTCRSMRTRCIPGANRYYTHNIEHYITPDGKWKLYDLKNDLFQNQDIASQNPKLFKKMINHYEGWWEDVWKEL
jgi:arylsulfatase A-like enzyme